MKKNFILSIALAAGISAFAASPFQGSAPAEGKFYLYQVETGRWLQPNMSKIDMWTTHAELGEVGMDIELRKLDGFEGYQIYCNFTNNGELNGSDEDRFFLDQGDRALCDWIFEPTDGGYKIMIKAKDGDDVRDRDRIRQDTYIGATEYGDYGGLSDAPEYYTWQLVSREERLAKMVADVNNGPVDATWLIPWNDLGRNDMRDRIWSRTQETDGGGIALDGSWGYPVQEFWHMGLMDWNITLEGLPEGTYGFSVQAYYRDTEIESTELYERYVNGTENLDRVSYFAGANSKHPMSIFAQAKPVEWDGFTYHVDTLGVDLWVPNSMGDASLAMINGAYINDYVSAPVSDGTLTVGIRKTDRDFRDWLIFKRFFLRYESTDLMAEDITPLVEQLTALIAEAKALPANKAFTEAIATAESALATSKTSSKLLAAINDLQAFVNEIKAAKDNINSFNATLAFHSDAEATEQFDTATNRDQFANALRTLRYSRRVAKAETHKDNFEGCEPAEGKFYLYNVGRQQFMQGGSDWGAHAALGYQGVELTFTYFDGDKESSTNDQGVTKYLIDTGLYNGENNHYLNYRGYMDCPNVDGFGFIPVEGKPGVYNMVQFDYPDVHTEWNPYGSTDGGQNDETNVCTESRNLDPNNPYAQWKLVTREQRAAMLEKATLDEPADATFMIVSPGFNQREAVEYWETSNFSIYGRNGNHPEFIMESFNSDEAELNQMVEGLPAGIYAASAQGFYRTGEWQDQPNLDRAQNAFLYFGNDSSTDTALANILDESGKAPGEGRIATAEDGTTYDVPGGDGAAFMAANFFKLGLYKTTVVVECDGSDMPLGVYKYVKGEEGDWVVVDNFRLKYYGNDTTVEAVQAKVDEEAGVETIEMDVIERPADNRIFNLQGMEVKNANVPGIYIQNGKKFIVR